MTDPGQIVSQTMSLPTIPSILISEGCPLPCYLSVPGSFSPSIAFVTLTFGASADATPGMTLRWQRIHAGPHPRICLNDEKVSGGNAYEGKSTKPDESRRP